MASALLQQNILLHPAGKSAAACPVCIQATPLRDIIIKVVPPLRPRVPVAACWQQRDMGAKNLPDDLLPIPQVHNVAEKNSEKRSTSTEENTMKKKKKKNVKGVTAPSNSVSIQKKGNHRPRTDKVHDMTKDATS